jgi:hypothetical protein
VPFKAAEHGEELVSERLGYRNKRVLSFDAPSVQGDLSLEGVQDNLEPSLLSQQRSREIPRLYGKLDGELL